MTRDDARRGNLREHGEPDRGVYFGRDPRWPTGDGVLVRIAREARAIRLRDTAGNTVAAFGDTTKFWLAATRGEASPPRHSHHPNRDPDHPGPSVGRPLIDLLDPE